MWVNFTCKSSEANPPVHNYVLLRNEKGVGLSEKGTWIEKISRGETFVYGCRAYQQVDNVSSTDNVTVTVNGKIKICPKQTITFSEYCMWNCMFLFLYISLKYKYHAFYIFLRQLP